MFIIFFFFQAEDGIRDTSVTGVQTCALPIYPFLPRPRLGVVRVDGEAEVAGGVVGARAVARGGPRSEERRVGKECRSRWSAYRVIKAMKGADSTQLRVESAATRHNHSESAVE